MNNRNQPPIQLQITPLSPWVKKIIIANVAIWFFVQIVLENLLLKSSPVTALFGLTPQLFIEYFFIWQPLTYMFLHSESVFHILFNMISLWFFASELEYRWGGRSFLLYYLSCGVGAALIYLFGVILVGLVQGLEPMVYRIPVIGASGAVFSVLLAYGVLFGDRIIYFFGVFPMQARYFVMVIGGVEVFSLMTSGLGGSQVANLAHIGGLISGYLYLYFWTRSRRNGKPRGARRNLRLVVNNSKAEPSGKSDGPRFWN